MHPVQNFYYSKELPPEVVALMHVQSTPITPADYTDKLNVLPERRRLNVNGHYSCKNGFRPR